MIVLLTNDDGIESRGIEEMRKALDTRYEVWMFAPDGDRSGTSHSITLKDAVRVKQIGEKQFVCSGSPADCVLYSLLGALPVIPDVVISGVNHGANLGTDIIYSGTAAAARQAALSGKPGIAVSVFSEDTDYKFSFAAQFVLENIRLLLTLWSPQHFININIPVNAVQHSRVAITHPSRRIYKDKLVRFNAPDGSEYFFIDGSNPAADPDETTDWHAVQEGSISVSPVYLHPLNQKEDEAYHAAAFTVPRI